MDKIFLTISSERQGTGKSRALEKIEDFLNSQDWAWGVSIPLSDDEHTLEFGIYKDKLFKGD